MIATGPTWDDIHDLQGRVDELEQRVEQLEERSE